MALILHNGRVKDSDSPLHRCVSEEGYRFGPFDMLPTLTLTFVCGDASAKPVLPWMSDTNWTIVGTAMGIATMMPLIHSGHKARSSRQPPESHKPFLLWKVTEFQLFAHDCALPGQAWKGAKKKKKKGWHRRDTKFFLFNILGSPSDGDARGWTPNYQKRFLREGAIVRGPILVL